MTLDARYPIGKYTKPAQHTPASRSASIDVLAALPATLRSIASHWSDEQLDTPYRDGGWTARQLIHHIADSHTNMIVRVRLALTEDWPTIKVYEEKAWAELYDAKTMPIAVSLSIIESLHARIVTLLRTLNEKQWQRGFMHPVNGPSVLEDVIAMYAWHSRHHTAHLTGLAKARGWQ